MKKGIVDYNVQEYFEGHLLVKQATYGTARNGNGFLTVILGDATGDIKTMVWNADDNKIKTFQSGQIMYVKGNITEYQSNKQLQLMDYDTTDDGDGINITDLLQRAPIEGNTLLAKIVAEVNTMTNETLKQITLEILMHYSSEFKTHPAAKRLHHAYVSGLAYHTYSMLNLGKALCELYPILNKDLLLSGIILHDIGKIKEYTSYLNTEVTLEGKLKGHISIMNEEINHHAKRIGLEDEEEVILLQHMILSHHGLQSNGWGSAVSPQIIEANILHHIDSIDAEMDTLTSAVTKTEPKAFTERLFSLDNRAFYHHNLPK